MHARRYARFKFLLSGALVAASSACGASTAPNAAAATPTAAAVISAGIVDVPQDIPQQARERVVVAKGLRNPRGLYLGQGGAMLVAEAGTGTDADGRMLRLLDRSGSGTFLDTAAREVVLDHQPSKNLIHVVRRDEVFGLAGIAEGGGDLLVSLAFFGGPSTILKVDGNRVEKWGETHVNINDLTYDPTRKAWFGVASTTDEIVKLIPGGATERIVKVPPLSNGQDAVPAYITVDPRSGELLATLFTGSPEGEEGGKGIEIRPRAGGIIAISPETKSFRWVVRGLTVPTDLEVAADGTIYVLEFCDAFLEPAATVEELFKHPSHGGFRRFSGRLLRVDRATGVVREIARGLDAPTNLLLRGADLYISEGMGTPGREIPGPTGAVKLDGFIERVTVAP